MDGLIQSDGARSRNRTGTVLPPRDFKSLASTNFAIRANWRCKIQQLEMEAEVGIEPAYTELQSAA